MPRHLTRAAYAAALLCLLVAPAARAATMSITSLTGEVTAADVSSFVNFMNTQTPATDDNGNQMADGSTGQDVEACCKLFEVCSAVPALAGQRLAVLNHALRFC